MFMSFLFICHCQFNSQAPDTEPKRVEEKSLLSSTCNKAILLTLKLQCDIIALCMR